MLAMRVVAIILTLTLAVSTAHAKPLTANDVRDVQCLIYYNDLSMQTLDQTKTQEIGFASIVSYFAGKLYARNKDVDLKAAVISTINKGGRNLTEAQISACQSEAVAFGQAMTDAAPVFE